MFFNKVCLMLFVVTNFLYVSKFLVVLTLRFFMMLTIFFQVICLFTHASWRIFSLMGHGEASRVFFISKNFSSTFISLIFYILRP